MGECGAVNIMFPSKRVVLTRRALDRIVDSEQRNSSFVCRLETANLAHGGLQNTGGDIVANFTIHQVKSVSEQ